MKIHGIPGSLVELLGPVRREAEFSGLYPRDFEDLRIKGDIGAYLQRVVKLYGRRSSREAQLFLPGAVAEHRFIDELRVLLPDDNVHLFNNCRISNQDEVVSGCDLVSFPDHLLISPFYFIYIETKNWTREYFSRNLSRLERQLYRTRANLNLFLKERGIFVVPETVVYDFRGEFSGSCKSGKVIKNPADVLRISEIQNIQDYISIVNLLKGLV